MRLFRIALKTPSQLMLFLFAVLGISCVTAQTETYCYAVREGGDSLLLDVYRPALPRADKAAVVYVHGGAFRTGTRADELDAETCRLLAQQGFLAVSIDYRLGAKEIKMDTVNIHNAISTVSRVFQVAVEDFSSATAFVVAHAAEWNVDETKIFFMGSSAGAITVLQADYCRANQHPWTAELPRGFCPAGVISYAGAIFSTEGDVRYKSTPAPTLFFHGTADKIVVYDQYLALRYRFSGTNRLVKTFNRSQYPYWFYRMKDHCHEVSMLMPLTPEIVTDFANAVGKQSVGQYTYDYQNAELQTPEWARKGLFEL